MTGRNLAQGDYRIGQRIAAGRDRRQGLDGTVEYGAIRIETVEWIDDEARTQGWNARIALRHGDDVRTALLCRSGVRDQEIERSPWTTLWTEPLPSDDAAALAFVGAVAACGTYRGVALLWIGAVGPDGTTYAHLLTERLEGDGEQEQAVRETAGMCYGTRAIQVRCDPPPAPRSLVAVRLGDAGSEGGLAVHECGAAATILVDVSLEAAAAAMPVTKRREGSPGACNLAGWSRIDEAEERAHALNEPSEALTLCWSDGRSRQVKCLAKTGIDFWRNDDPEAYAEGTIPGPGLWMWRDVTYRGYHDHEGGYDADMDGRWEPATRADVLRMVGSIKAAEDDIGHYADEIVEDPVGTYVGMAEALVAGQPEMAA